jgi:hypothetical protein
MAIEQHLYNGEKIIQQGNVTIFNSSTLGTHSLYITNKRRILAHDSGGIFGGEKIHIYPFNLKINVEFLETVISISSNSNNLFSFELTLDIKEYLELLDYFKYDDFIFERDSKNIGYILLDDGYTILTSYQIFESKLEFKAFTIHDPFVIDYSEVENINEKFNLINIKARKPIFGQLVNRFSLFIPDHQNRSAIIQLVNSKPKIFDLITSDERVFSAFMKCQINDATKIEYDVFILESTNQIRILIKSNLKLLLTRNKDEVDPFYDNEGKQIILKIGENFFFLKPIDMEERELQIFKSSFGHFIGNYLTNTGDLNGFVNGVKYVSKTVDVALSEQSLYIVDKATKLLINNLTITQYKFIKADNLLFLTDNNWLSVMKLKDTYIEKFLELNHFTDEKVMLDSLYLPYFYEQTKEGLKLYQSDLLQPILYYHNKSIGSLRVQKEKIAEGIFTKVSFTDSDNNKMEKLYIPTTSLNQLIYTTFISNKSPVLVSTTGNTLYKSMVRQLSDLLLYEYFGQLSALYKGIEEFYSVKMDENERNEKLVSYLYHGIQSQRKRMDSVSVYIPALLNQYEQQLFKKYNRELDDKNFKVLQQKLIGLSNQLKGSLIEIENNLTHLTSILAPRRSMEDLIAERKKSGYKNAALGAVAAGAITVLTGGAALPLLMGPAFMGLNTHSSTKAMELQQEIQDENEQSRTQFYLFKSLDLFDHFFVTMVPYYIAKVNDIIFECYKNVALEYKPLLEERYIKENMLHRIAEIHTFKNLPVDPTVDVSKQELLNEIFEIASGSENIIKEYSNTLSLPNQVPSLSQSF